MKFKIIDQYEYNKWIESFCTTEESHLKLREDCIKSLDVSKLIDSSNTPPFFTEDIDINVEISVLVEYLIEKFSFQTIESSDFFTDEILQDVEAKGFSISKSFDKSKARVVEAKSLYCPSLSSQPLKFSRSLSSYDLRQNEILILGIYRKFENENIEYDMGTWRDLTDFSNLIRDSYAVKTSKNLLYRPMPAPETYTKKQAESWYREANWRPLEGILLYTDEDLEIAKYVRLHFSSLDKMSGSYINVYCIENPAKIKNIPPRDYWKAQFNEKLYYIFSLIGATQSRPYAKENCYKIANQIGLTPDRLPCLVLFSDITSNEKIVLKIPTNLTPFFRNVFSRIHKVMESLIRNSLDYYLLKEQDNNKFFRKFRDGFFDYSSLSDCQKSITFLGVDNTSLKNSNRKGSIMKPKLEIKDNKNLYAVCIGINKYKDEDISNLNFAKNDAEEFVNLLKSNFPSSSKNIKLLVDEDATNFEIRDLLEGYLKNNSTEEDIVVIFYSGHGSPELTGMDKIARYLVPHDAIYDKIVGSCISLENFDRILEKISAKQIIVFMDSCFSGRTGGKTFRGFNAKDAVIPETNLIEEISGEGRMIVCAAKDTEIAFEHENLQHGIFTHTLLQGLCGIGVSEKRSTVKFTDLLSFIEDEVPSKCRKLSTKKIQTPIYKGYNEHIVLPVLKKKL